MFKLDNIIIIYRWIRPWLFNDSLCFVSFNFLLDLQSTNHGGFIFSAAFTAVRAWGDVDGDERRHPVISCTRLCSLFLYIVMSRGLNLSEIRGCAKSASYLREFRLFYWTNLRGFLPSNTSQDWIPFDLVCYPVSLYSLFFNFFLKRHLTSA